MQGAGLVLATGRPVLYMGGFNGSDEVVDAAVLARLVQSGELRYVLGSTTVDIRRWLEGTCSPVDGVDLIDVSHMPRSSAGQVEAGMLYRCDR